MAWFILIASGALEAVWATALSATEGFKRLKPTLLFLVSMTVSMLGLAYAMKTLPTGTSYAIWVAVGAILTVILAIIRGEEKLTVMRAIVLSVLIGCIVGLKAVS